VDVEDERNSVSRPVLHVASHDNSGGWRPLRGDARGRGQHRDESQSGQCARPGDPFGCRHLWGFSQGSRSPVRMRSAWSRRPA